MSRARKAEMESQYEANLVDLKLLLIAIHADDPKRELLVRVGDLIRNTKTAIAKSTGTSP